MKIYRIQTETSDAQWAESPNGTDFYALSGSLEGFSQTGKLVIAKKVLAPVLPPAIYIVGYNYSNDLAAARADGDRYPVIVMKAVSTVIADGDAIELPDPQISSEVDYEGELAVVIGRSAKNVSTESASDYILGYTIANDLTARDWQRNGAGGQWVRAKNFDTFCPLGPAIVTADSVDLEKGLRIQTWINDELRQDDTTNSMVFPINEVVAHLSAYNTLLPGTVILTGTPSGIGKHQVPPAYLKSGDRIRIEIQALGVLENRVG
ncbi:MAG: fumarylacetoacetate hydrolase family protein [Opitutaceae bacterium]